MDGVVTAGCWLFPGGVGGRAGRGVGWRSPGQGRSAAQGFQAEQYARHLHRLLGKTENAD